MKKLFFVMLISTLLSFASYAQTNPSNDKTSNTQTTNEEKPKKQIFRAKKDRADKQQKPTY